jgi:hypothetical protein
MPLFSYNNFIYIFIYNIRNKLFLGGNFMNYMPQYQQIPQQNNIYSQQRPAY